MMQINEPIWTSAEMAAACGAITVRPWYADGMQVDSRQIMFGDLFVALRGSDTDGHNFVADAFERGAVAAVVCDQVPGIDGGDQRLVHVADTMEALNLMAIHARNRAPSYVVGVTGSAGKTSVVQALRQAFERAGPTHASIKSYNNHVGVPLSVARMPRQTRHAVFELGMSSAGEITHGANIVRPDMAVITTIGAAHTEGFQDVASITREKAALFDALPKGGVAVIGLDHAYSEQLLGHAKDAGAMAITVSVLHNADVRPIRMTEHHNCTCLTADVFGTLVTYKIAQPGREWVLNSLLILAAVKAAGADLGQAALALASLEAEPGRGRAHQLNLGHGHATLLDDSYNANPLSLRAALRRLSLVPVCAPGKRVAVLADMQELGSKSEELHLSLLGDLKRFNVNKVIAFGDQIASLGEHAGIATERWNDPEISAARLMNQLSRGDAVMVKGANSAALDSMVAGMLEISRNEEVLPTLRERRAGY